MSRKILIDTDGTYNDLSAHLIAFKNKAIQVIGIIVSGGRVDIDISLKNIALFYEHIGKKGIPIYKGISSLYEKNEIKKFPMGKNGLCGYELPIEVYTSVSKQDGIEAYKSLAENNINEITVVILGPCTTLGAAYDKYPEIKNKFRNIFVAGGNYDNEIEGDATKYAEFNAFVNPTAMRKVLHNFKPSSGLQIFMIDNSFQFKNPIGLATLKHMISYEEGDTYPNPKKEFLKSLDNMKFCDFLYEYANKGMKSYIMFSACYFESVEEKVKCYLEKIDEMGKFRGKTFLIEGGYENISMITSLNLLHFKYVLIDSVRNP